MARQAVLSGLGTYLPPTVVTNEMLAEVLATTDEWIRTRTGIRQRHIAAPGVCTSVLAAQAGERALASAGLSEVDALILATTTPDRSCPATAPEIADRLGLGGIPAFDVSAACTGFIYALATATGLISSGLYDRVLMIGADTFSTVLNPNDRTTRALLGDGAGAVVLRLGQPDDPGALLGFDLGSDGSQVGLLEIPAGGSRQRSAGGPVAEEDNYFQMQGKPVFTNAVLCMTKSVEKLLAEIGWNALEIDHLVPHQANARILAAVADQLGLAADRVVSNIDRVGNTVAASIPLALAHGLAEQQVHPGDQVVLTAFGAGLTWGSAALVWPEITAASN